jgi:hypothetical protein
MMSLIIAYACGLLTYPVIRLYLHIVSVRGEISVSEGWLKSHGRTKDN